MEGCLSKHFIVQISAETVVLIRVLAVQDLVRLDTTLTGEQLLLPKSTLKFETLGSDAWYTVLAGD